jgi:hypothetical protein
MNDEIAEVVSSFRSNSILQKKLLEEVAKFPGHSNLRLLLLQHVVIDTVSMLQPGATNSVEQQAICNWYAETTRNDISFLGEIRRCQEVVHRYMLEQ